MKRRIWTTLALLASAALLLIVAIFLWDPIYLPARAARAYLFETGIREHTTLVHGYRISYLESKPKPGQPDRPIVLIHGLGANKDDWAPVAVPLVQAGFHVYALDLLGYGDSDTPDDGNFSMQQEEDITLGFLDAMRLKKADVAGWSMGGWVAMKLALDHPDRLRRLVVLNSAGVYFPFTGEVSLFTPTNRAGLERLVYTLEPNKPFLYIPRWAVGGLLRRIQPKNWVVERSFVSMMSGRELLDFLLPQMRVPMLIVWGKEDHLIPFTTAERIHALVPRSMLVGVRGCGHLAPGECSRQVSSVMVKYLDAAEPAMGATTVDGPRR